jgi:integrase/recombinase XerC
VTVHRLPPTSPAGAQPSAELSTEIQDAIASLVVDDEPDAPRPSSPVASYLLRFSTANGRRAVILSLRRIARAMNIPDGNWQAIPWEKLGPQHTGVVHARLIDMGHSPSTIRLTRTVLKGVLSEAQKMGLITGDQLMAATSWPRLQGKRAPAGRMLTDDEVQRLRAHCRSLSPAVYRAMALALVACALGGGMRREELATVEAEALSDDGRHLRFVGKGRKEVVQPLPEWAAADVRAWLEVRRRFPLTCKTMFVKVDPRCRRLVDRPLTPWEVWKLVRDLQQGAGLPSFSPHDLRRTFASALIEQEGLDKAKTLMRHENVATTLVYDRRPQSEAEKALGALEKWGGG